MNRKRPIGVIIISLASILYGVLDIGQFFMPTVTKGRIEYSIPFLGILLLIFGFGTLALKEWARKGMIFAFIWAVFQSALAIYHGELIFGNVVFITLYCSIILYLSRPAIGMKFKKVAPESGANGI